jgi:hypothetical protein
MFTTSWQVNPQLRRSKSVYMYDLKWHTCILFTYVTWTETFKTCFNHTEWTEMFTTCLPVCHELRCSQPVYLYATNWDVQTPFPYTPLWTKAFTTHLPILNDSRYSQPAYLHALKWCLNPIHQYSSVLRCEQFGDQYILNWDVCNLFKYTLTEVFGTCWHASPVLRHVQPVNLHFLNCNVHNLLIHLPWNKMIAHCLPILMTANCWKVSLNWDIKSLFTCNQSTTTLYKHLYQWEK